MTRGPPQSVRVVIWDFFVTGPEFDLDWDWIIQGINNWDLELGVRFRATTT
jgi:hypothetical protein